MTDIDDPVWRVFQAAVATIIAVQLESADRTEFVDQVVKAVEQGIRLGQLSEAEQVEARHRAQALRLLVESLHQSSSAELLKGIFPPPRM